jgi:hypothetical protein
MIEGVKMKKVGFILLMIFILSMISCSNKDVIKHNYYFKGESELWDAYYQEKSVETFTEKNGRLVYDSDTEATFTAVYKYGLSDLKEVKKIEIGYDAGSFSSSLSSEYGEEGPYSKAFVMSSSSGFVSNENGTIKVTIRVDGNTETFELEKQ